MALAVNKNKVLHIITTGESGGAQTHLYDLCTHMPDRYKPLVAMGQKGTLGDKLAQANIPVYIVPSLQREISLFRDGHAYREIQQLINELQPDLICTHSSKAGFLGRLAARAASIPVIFTVHGWAFTEGVAPLRRLLYRILERWAARWTARLICVSDYDFQLACRYRVAAAQRMTTIHNGIPPGAYQGEDAGKSNADRTIRMIMVARFSAQKDQSLLLQAVSEMQLDHPFEVVLVGDGPLLPLVRDYAAGLRISDKIKFLGDRSDVEDLLNQADIFVLTSHWEGFPITILEAMRAGLPVIASDVGGCREAVADGQTGYLVKPGDSRGLTHYLEELVCNRDLRSSMGQAGYERFINNFTADKMVEKTLLVYDEVLRASGQER
jgi:glycosyltransferase involved in cell wall biosynthesis